MRLLAALLTALPLLVHAQAYQHELELQLRIKAKERLHPAMARAFEKRLDIADRIDRGQITPELGRKAMDALTLEATEAEARDIEAQQDRANLEEALRIQGAEDARKRRMREAGAAIIQGTQPRPAPGFFKGERVSGLNKICFYDQVGSTVALTIGAAEPCPPHYPR